MCWTISTEVLSPCTGEWEIKALKVKCNNYRNGCGWVGELRSLDDHLTTSCGYVLLCCTNECMEKKKEVRILRRDLDHHLKNKCPNRQYQCPYCKVTGRYCDITTIHSDTCPKVKVLCPNTDCKALVPRCKLADHQSKCQYEAVSCKYAEIGCQKRLSYRSLQRHENDDMAHLHLTNNSCQGLYSSLLSCRLSHESVLALAAVTVPPSSSFLKAGFREANFSKSALSCKIYG